MSDSSRVMSRPRQAWPTAARTAAAITAMAALAMLAAACGGNPSSTGSSGSSNAGRSANSQVGINYANCMRSHGVPTWPDPTYGAAGWGFDLTHVHGFDPNSTQIENKMDECSRGLPPGIGVPLSRPGRPG